MKKITLSAILLLTYICEAQIINIKDNGTVFDAPGQYYKDIDNVLNPFEGTWKYTNGTTSLTIVLEKRVNQQDGMTHEDRLIGEYQYVKNNSIIINTIPNLSSTSQFSGSYSISGNSVLINSYFPVCNDCTAGELRLNLGMLDKNTHRYRDVILRRIMVNGQEALKFKITGVGGYYHQDSPPSDNYFFPSGEYILIKQ